MPTSKTTLLLIQILYPSTKISFYTPILQLPDLKYYLHIYMAAFFKTCMEPGGRNTNNKKQNFGGEKIFRLAAFTKMLKTIISLSSIYG